MSYIITLWLIITAEYKYENFNHIKFARKGMWNYIKTLPENTFNMTRITQACTSWKVTQRNTLHHMQKILHHVPIKIRMAIIIIEIIMWAMSMSKIILIDHICNSRSAAVSSFLFGWRWGVESHGCGGQVGRRTPMDWLEWFEIMVQSFKRG